MPIYPGKRTFYLLFSWLVVFSLLPFSFVLMASFLTQKANGALGLPFTFEHYGALFTPTFLKIFCRSIVMASIVTSICLFLAWPFSYFIVKSRHQSILLLLICIPFWTSSLVRTYSLMAILKYHGILNAVLMKLHLIQAPLEVMYTPFAVVIGLSYNLLPFMILPLISNMERFDFRLIEASKDLGASFWFTFFHVILPNTKEGILSGVVMVFLPAMTLFYIPDVLGGARSMLLGNLIQNQFLTMNDWPQGAATSMMLTFLLLLIWPIYQWRRKVKG